MHISYTLPLTVFIAIALVIAAAVADLQINGAEKAGADEAILRSNGSVEKDLDLKITRKEKDIHLENNSMSNQMKQKDAGGLRKKSNNSDSMGELKNVGHQHKSNDSSAKKGDKREGSEEAAGEKGRYDSSSKRDGRKEEIKEVDQQEIANNSSSEKQDEEEKILPGGYKSRKEMLPSRKENLHGEECDSSYSCTIEEMAVVACLRVPGNESPDLSLLIQNKGKNPVSIFIKAPVFVKLEKDKIELQGKENKKMKVSIANSGNDNLIILKAGDGQCTLDFKGLNDNADKTSQFKYVFPSFGIMGLIAVVLVATILMYIRRKFLVSSGLKYQKLDMGLPVSSGGKIETLSTDGWDNSWDDNWDDEEAPKTPSMPRTSSLFNKSISSRRSTKEGWRD